MSALSTGRKGNQSAVSPPAPAAGKGIVRGLKKRFSSLRMADKENSRGPQEGSSTPSITRK